MVNGGGLPQRVCYSHFIICGLLCVGVPVQSPNYANNKFWNILHSPNDDMHRYSTFSIHSPKLQYIFYKYSVAHTVECKDPCPTSISKHKTTEQLKCRRLTDLLPLFKRRMTYFVVAGWWVWVTVAAAGPDKRWNIIFWPGKQKLCVYVPSSVQSPVKLLYKPQYFNFRIRRREALFVVATISLLCCCCWLVLFVKL